MKNEQQPKEKKNWLTVSNLITGLLLALLIALWVFPDLKALMLRGLMQAGLFRPEVPAETQQPAQAAGTDLTALRLKDSGGRELDPAAYKGKVIFLNFWATWCPPCIAEMPSIDALHENLGRDSSFVFLMVDVDGEPQRSAAFFRKHGYGLPLMIPGGPIPPGLFTGSLPTTVVIDRDGRIVLKHEGLANYNSPQFVQFMEGLAGRGR